jgi:hypothetical protein
VTGLNHEGEGLGRKAQGRGNERSVSQAVTTKTSGTVSKIARQRRQDRAVERPRGEDRRVRDHEDRHHYDEDREGTKGRTVADDEAPQRPVVRMAPVLGGARVGGSASPEVAERGSDPPTDRASPAVDLISVSGPTKGAPGKRAR